MNSVAKIALAPLSLAYGAVMKTRAALYERGVLRVDKVGAPVISVGNITTGGTGKTPMVEWIAKRFAEQKFTVCILTRGYGRDSPNERVVVSDGERITTDVRRSGDEAMMLAESLLGKAAVVCDSDRGGAAKWAIENMKSQVLILDDGFQHLRLARNLNIVTMTARNPFDNGFLLPAGMLREPVSSLSRADCVIVTRAIGDVDPQLRKRIKNATNAPILTSQAAISRVRLLNANRTVDIGELRSIPSAAFCGIGDPDSFFDQLSEENINVVHQVSFRDHQRYSQSDIDKLTADSVARGAQALITTAKDGVKLRELNFTIPCYVADIRLEITEEKELIELIQQAVNSTPH